MKPKSVRIIALLLCIALVFGLAAVFFVPGGGKPAPKSDLSPDTVLVTMEGHEILADEFFYYALNIRQQYEMYYGADYWTSATKEQGDQLLQNIEDMLVEMYAIQDWGEKQGFTMTDEMKAEVQAAIDEKKATFETEELYLADLTANQLTPALLEKMMTMNIYYEHLMNDFLTPDNPILAVSDAEIDLEIELQGYLGAKHILIANDEGDDVDENKSFVADLLTQIRGGGDFDALMQEHSEDPGLAASPDGYTFLPGQFVPEFEEATKELAIGDVSEIVESTHGFHIIKRTDVDREAVIQAAQTSKFTAYIDAEVIRLDPKQTPEREVLVLTEMAPVIY